MVPVKRITIVILLAITVAVIPVYAASNIGIINFEMDHLVGMTTIEQFQGGNQKLVTINLLYDYPSNASLAVQTTPEIQIDDPLGLLKEILIQDGANIYKQEPGIDTTPPPIIEVEEEDPEPTQEEIAELLGIPDEVKECLYGEGPYAAFQSKSAFDITSLEFTQQELIAIEYNIANSPHAKQIKMAIEACRVMNHYYNIVGLIGAREVNVAAADEANLDFHGRNVTELTNRGNDPTRSTEKFDITQGSLDNASQRAEDFKCSPEGRAMGHCVGDYIGINRGSPYDPATYTPTCTTIYVDDDSPVTKLVCPIQDMAKYFAANPEITPSVAQAAQIFAAQKQLCFDTWDQWSGRDIAHWPDVLIDGTCDFHLTDEKYTETIVSCYKGGEQVKCSVEVRKAGN